MHKKNPIYPPVIINNLPTKAQHRNRCGTQYARGTEGRTYSQLWGIYHTIADIVPTVTCLEKINHHAYLPWHQPLDPKRVTTRISPEETEVKSHTNPINSPCRDPEHLLIYTDGLQTRNGNTCNIIGWDVGHGRDLKHANRDIQASLIPCIDLSNKLTA